MGWQARNRAAYLLARRAAHRAVNPVSDLVCPVCLTAFTPRNSHPANLHCSPACKKVAKWRNQSPRRRRADVAVAKVREQVIATNGMVCHLCGAGIASLDRQSPWGLTIDHVIPVARGGDDSPANLRPAHRACNVAKGTKDALADYLRVELGTAALLAGV